MADDSFRKFRCWRTAEVHETVFGDIGCAPHPRRRRIPRGPRPRPGGAQQGRGSSGWRARQRSSTRSADEIGIAGRNTLIAVTGDVGTGKSHAVRWVRAHLDDDPQRYRTIYVPRDLSTLRGLLGRILEGLPGQKARQAERQLDDAIGGKSDSQLRDELIDNLRQVLAFELPDEGPGDQDADDREERTSCSGSARTVTPGGATGLPTSSSTCAVREHLSRDGGTVAAVIHSIQAERGGRDESVPAVHPGRHSAELNRYRNQARP